MKKEHLDLENQITNEEWEDFINDYQDRFSEETSYIARKYLENLLYIEIKMKATRKFYIRVRADYVGYTKLKLKI